MNKATTTFKEMGLLDSARPRAEGSTALCGPPLPCSKESGGISERAHVLCTCPTAHRCERLVCPIAQRTSAPCPWGVYITLSAPLTHSPGPAGSRDTFLSSLRLIHSSSGQFRSIHSCGRRARARAPIPLKKLESQKPESQLPSGAAGVSLLFPPLFANPQTPGRVGCALG